jgi:predicted DNA-binding transcriptional regulator YafY
MLNSGNMGPTLYNKEELESLKEAAALLEKYKFSDVFGDISGALQKVIDVIEISTGQHSGENYDFISPEKVPHIRGSEHLAPIIQAIKSEKALRIYYQPFYEDKPYFNEVHPYLLKEYRNRWYMIGLNDFKGQLRTYSLDRIRDIQAASIPYKRQSFSAREYFTNAVGVISPEGDPPRIRIAVQKTQAQYLITQPWHESQNIEEETGDEVIFSFRVHPTYEFLSLLLSFGKDTRVLSPESLKAKVKEELLEMLKHYTKEEEKR